MVLFYNVYTIMFLITGLLPAMALAKLLGGSWEATWLTFGVCMLTGDLLLRTRGRDEFHFLDLFHLERGAHVLFPFWFWAFFPISDYIGETSLGWIIPGILLGFLSFIFARDPPPEDSELQALPCIYCQQPLTIPSEPRPVGVACPRCQARFVIRE